MEEDIAAARKAYVKLLKFCNEKVNDYPSNLLQLLDEAHANWHKLLVKRVRHT